jgi:tetratricopeptide (TPR) repeat protein
MGRPALHLLRHAASLKTNDFRRRSRLGRQPEAKDLEGALAFAERMQPRTAGLWLFAALAFAGVPAAAQDTSPPAQAEDPAAAAEEGADLEQLRARHRAMLADVVADPTNLDLAFEYAALSARIGELEEAISTLERMLIFAPGLPRLQLELGVLYFRLGAYETAQLYFDAALAGPDVPDEVRTNVAPYLAAIRERTATSRLSGIVLGGVRWQSNANAAPQGRIVNLNGLPFVLDETATGEADWNSFLSSNVTYSQDLASQGDRFEANLLTYGALYAEHDEINTALAELTFGPSFNLERIGLEDAALGIYGILAGVGLEEDMYLASVGGGAALSKFLGARTQASLRSEYRREEYFDSPTRPTSSDRSGDLYRGQTTLQHQLTSRFAVFSAVTGEIRDAREDYLSSWEVGGALGGSLSLPSPVPQQDEAWVLALTGGYLYRDFDEPDPAINALEAEVDEEAFVQGTLTVPIDDGWALQASGGYRNIDSNYDTRKFDNINASLGALKQF